MIPTGNTASNLALSEGDSKGISQIGNFRVSPRGFGGVRSDFTILFGCLARFRCQSKIDDLYRDSFCGHFHGNHRRRSKWNAIVIDRPSRAPGHESHRSVVEQSSRISLRTSSLVGCFRSTVRLVSINRVVVVAVVVVRRPLPLKNGNELASPCHLVDGWNSFRSFDQTLAECSSSWPIVPKPFQNRSGAAKIPAGYFRTVSVVP